MAFRPYGQLDEKEYPVSDAEINKAYAEEKGQFKVEEPTKEISFIAVNIAPSDVDRAASTKLAMATASAATLGKDLRKEGLSVEKKTLRASDLPGGQIRTFLTSAPHDSVSVVTDNMRGFTVVKMGRRYNEVDSVKINLVTVAGADLPEKVLARLNSGLPVDSIGKFFKPDSVMAQTEQWITLYDKKGKTDMLQQSQLDSLKNAGGRFVKIAGQGSPKEIYEYQVVEYSLHPSAATVNDAIAKLEKFLAANTTAAKFRENAAKEGYNLQTFELTQSSNAVPRMQGYNMYYPDSRQVVRWVMIDGKPGEVSKIYESKEAATPALYVAAVNSEYDEYVPVSNPEVKKYITEKVRRSKAGDAQVKKYQAKASDMASVAAAMGVQPTDMAQFRFSARSGVNDPKVMGQIAGGKPGKKVVVVKGDDGVYAYVINGRSKENFKYDDATYQRQFQQLFQTNMEQMLRGSKKIENNVYKFEAGD